MLKCSNYIYIPKEKFTEKLQSYLTLKNPIYEKKKQLGIKLTDDDSPYLFLYNEKDDYYLIPRYTFKTELDNLACSFIDIPINISWNNDAISKVGEKIILNSSQKVTINNAIKMLKEFNGGLVHGETGEGKTTIAIKIITEIKQKTLILCHKDNLIAQWVNAISNLTDITKNKIGYLKAGKFKDGDIVIGSIRSLYSDTFEERFNNMFGFVIQDEIHIIGARQFIKAFTRFNPKYRLGLSATPTRADGMEKMYFLHLGKHVVKHKSVRTVPLFYKSFDYTTRERYKRYPSYIPDKTALINNIIVDEPRNELIIEAIEPYVNNNERVIIFSERIKHLKRLMMLAVGTFPDKKILRFFGEEKVTRRKKKWVFTVKKGSIIYDDFDNSYKVIKFNREKSLIYLDNNEVYDINEIVLERGNFLRKYVARRYVKVTEVLDTYNEPPSKIIDKADIIFATYTKAQDSLDSPSLSVCLYATPFGSQTVLQQTGGRIKRKFPDKERGIILDINDRASYLAVALFNKRLFGYWFLGIKNSDEK